MLSFRQSGQSEHSPSDPGSFAAATLLPQGSYKAIYKVSQPPLVLNGTLSSDTGAVYIHIRVRHPGLEVNKLLYTFGADCITRRHLRSRLLQQYETVVVLRQRAVTTGGNIEIDKSTTDIVRLRIWKELRPKEDIGCNNVERSAP